MQMTRLKKPSSFIVCIVLIAAMALITTGCSADTDTTSAPLATFNDGDTVGKGDTQFTLTVTDDEGVTTSCTVNTDKKTVGEALTELGLLAGEKSQYGLYIKTVNGLTFDYDKDKKYWAFYIGGEYANESADLTEIAEGAEYSFKVE